MDWFSIVVVGTVGFVAVPRAGFALAGASRPVRLAWLRWVAAAIFIVSWALPDLTLDDTDTFVQHAVGGGASCAVLGFFVATNLGLRAPLLRMGLAYTVAAAFGVFVEVMELIWDEVGDSTLTEDASWDLAANSIGAVVTALVLELIVVGLRRRSVQ